MRYFSNAMRRNSQVWLIDEGHAGHRVQAEGMVAALTRLGIPLHTRRIDCQPRLRGIFRPAARAVFSRLGARSAGTLAHRVAQFEEPGGPPPSFIISSGGRTAFASRALSLRSGAPNVFVGNPKPFPMDWFSAVVSPVPLPQGDAILTGVVPNTVTPEDCTTEARRYWGAKPPPRLWSLLIGGPSRNHLYAAQDWRNIAAGVNALAARHGIKWLISTSRRTGAQAEAILEAQIAPDAIEELVLYSREPKRVVLAFLGAGERVFVTRDSLTMLSEAIMSGRPVTALLPEKVELASDNFMAVVLRKYDEWAQFTQVTCADLASFAPPAGHGACALHQAAEELELAAEHLTQVLNCEIAGTICR